jgi:hypothetical protein
MRSIFVAAACLAAALAGPLAAQDVERLYTQAELKNAGGRYSPSLKGLWDEDFLSRVTPAERQRAGSVALVLPLVGAQRTPIDFYALPRERRVYLPISSIKFLDDITIAIAYHESRQCGIGLVSDYVGVLRERPGELSGSPREALGVPADALKDPMVDDVSQKLLKSMVFFVVAHEYAHVMYGHPGYKSISAQEAQRQETEADAFALEVMRRIAVPPLSMAHFFALVSRLENSPADFETPAQYEAYIQQRASHPVSSQRLLAVADALQANAASYARLQPNPQAWTQRVLVTAGEIRAIGKTLDDRAMRRFMTHRSRTVAPASLRTGCK